MCGHLPEKFQHYSTTASTEPSIQVTRNTAVAGLNICFASEFKKMSNGLDLMSLVSGAIKIYSKLNEEDED